LTTFLNPWATQYNGGYQLTQSLIAFGRGGWFGVGLGESVQKLFYLPEAHTDFLFAVLTEELGLIGGLVVIALFAVVVARALIIGRKAYLEHRHFAAFIAYGFAMELALQVMINIGVNAGVLPTKGLTLPFMSYGGSSLLMMCAMIGILLRIDYETRMAAFGYRIQQRGNSVHE
jgi:cell division protein FtsW